MRFVTGIHRFIPLMYFVLGSNDAWRQHPWLKAKHNIRYM
jgi:hypothetical protein